MTIRSFTWLVLCFLCGPALFAQEQDPVLFTVEDETVHLSEFKYIYEKTNGQKADYSRESLEEYLDLYIKFKLKVQRAEDMQLDTIPSLQQELAGYRRTLADSYLIDREVTDKLTREVYERMQQDVDISHILISVPSKATPADTLAAYEKALEAKKRLGSGEAFKTVAGEMSDDESAQRNGGHIGYVTALFPNGFYPLETAAYALPVGAISDPIRTSSGYHILKVRDRRPARGEMEGAHLMLRTKGKDPELVKKRIDSIYQVLQQGADFATLANELTEDGFSKGKGGRIGFFGINRYEKPFEEAAFAIEEDGGLSKPVQTSVGWHIIQRISKRDIQPYEIEQRRLEAKVKQDARFEAAREAMVERIKRQGHFRDHPQALNPFIDTLSKDFFTFRWQPPQPQSQKPLFSLDGLEISLGNFTDYLGKASRKRISLGRTDDVGQAVRQLYEDFVRQTCMAYEESKLEEKYPEFRYLMNEYEEGILLFEATQREVWDRASQDSAGLEKFYEQVKHKFRWDERARITNFYLSAEAKDKIDDVRAYARNHSAEETLAKFNTEARAVLASEEKILERTKNNAFIGTPWKVGGLSEPKENSRNGTLTFLKIEELLPSQIKTLEEARGYIVAEYQDYLEKKWVEELRSTYEVTVNEEVFESMVKE